MTDEDLIQELRKAARLYTDGIYTPDLLVGHLMQVVKDEKNEVIAKALIVKGQLERLIHLIEDLREVHRDIKAGKKHLASRRTNLGKDIDLAITKLHAAGYNTDRFKQQVKQKEIFNG